MNALIGAVAGSAAGALGTRRLFGPLPCVRIPEVREPRISCRHPDLDYDIPPSTISLDQINIEIAIGRDGSFKVRDKSKEAVESKEIDNGMIKLD